MHELILVYCNVLLLLLYISEETLQKRFIKIKKKKILHVQASYRPSLMWISTTCPDMSAVLEVAHLNSIQRGCSKQVMKLVLLIHGNMIYYIFKLILTEQTVGLRCIYFGSEGLTMS